MQPLTLLLLSLFLSGAVMGPLLDGIHGNVHLLEVRSAFTVHLYV